MGWIVEHLLDQADGGVSDVNDVRIWKGDRADVQAAMTAALTTHGEPGTKCQPTTHVSETTLEETVGPTGALGERRVRAGDMTPVSEQFMFRSLDGWQEVAMKGELVAVREAGERSRILKPKMMKLVVDVEVGDIGKAGHAMISISGFGARSIQIACAIMGA